MGTNNKSWDGPARNEGGRPSRCTIDQCNEKSNEITAIPRLLEMLELSGSLVTIDAMGCQTEIAKRIVPANVHYCLAVKNNQPTLHHGLVQYFSDHLEDDFARVKSRRFEKEEEGHGRQESRWYFICPVPKDLPDRHRWPHLKAVGVAISQTQPTGKSVTTFSTTFSANIFPANVLPKRCAVIGRSRTDCTGNST